MFIVNYRVKLVSRGKESRFCRGLFFFFCCGSFDLLISRSTGLSKLRSVFIFFGINWMHSDSLNFFFLFNVC